MDKPHLVLGTVGFGLDGYSIPNTGKLKPSKNEVFAILQYAVDNGIRYIDTANDYGNAEDLIGEFGANNFLVTSKLKSKYMGSLNKKSLQNTIEKECVKDLNRLKVDSLYGYYLHTYRFNSSIYLYNDDVLDALYRCKDIGLIQNVGVSIYTAADALYAAQNSLDIIQVPYNILDQRLHYNSFFDVAKKNKVKVFGRSPFLKGILTMSQRKIPEYLKNVIPYLRKIDEVCGKNRIKTALFFSLSNETLDGVVFGVDNLIQFKEDVNIYNTFLVNKNEYKRLRHIPKDINDYIITPSIWGGEEWIKSLP